jgi:hypothetical protein
MMREAMAVKPARPSVTCVSRLQVTAKMRSDLKAQGWRGQQVRAMAPFAAFHAARVISEWHALCRFCTEAEALDETLWAGHVPEGELW